MEKNFHFILSLKGGLQRTRNRVLEKKWRKECHGGTTTLRMIPDPDFLSYKFYQVRFGKFHTYETA